MLPFVNASAWAGAAEAVEAAVMASAGSEPEAARAQAALNRAERLPRNEEKGAGLPCMAWRRAASSRLGRKTSGEGGKLEYRMPAQGGGGGDGVEGGSEGSGGEGGGGAKSRVAAAAEQGSPLWAREIAFRGRPCEIRRAGTRSAGSAAAAAAAVEAATAGVALETAMVRAAWLRRRRQRQPRQRAALAGCGTGRRH